MTGGDVERFDLARTLDVQVAVLRCQRSALLHGASDLERSVIATIVSELGSNVLKYARRGTLELRRARRGLATDIEITVRDDGPGIADVSLALTDHYSSGRSLGLGLPAVRRMADALDIVCDPEGGTTVRARKRLARSADQVRTAPDASDDRLRAEGRRWRAAATVRPRHGQRHAGDAVVVAERSRYVLLAVIDATGHGPAAHALALDLAARLRSRFAATSDPWEVATLLRDVHEACVGTAGAAAGLGVVDTERARLRYLAVGNVRSAVIGTERFRGVARDGVLGRRWPTPFVQHADLQAGDMLLLWSDGLPESLARTLAAHPPGMASLLHVESDALCDAVIAQHAKRHDDAACLALRWRP